MLFDLLPAMQRHKVGGCGIKTHESAIPSEIRLLSELMKNSMADYSTTVSLILILFAGDLWAQCQPCKGIRYVPVASKLRKSMSSVDNVLSIKRVIFYLAADCSTAAGRILIVFTGGCWDCHGLHKDIEFITW